MEENFEAELPIGYKPFDPSDLNRLIDYKIAEASNSSTSSFAIISPDEVLQE